MKTHEDKTGLRVSVVAATYRRPHLLEQLLESLAAQTFPREDFEVVIVDDGSGDETIGTLERWRDREDLPLRFTSQENSGPAAARNRGYRMAKAPLIAFTDDDCIAEPEWLAGLVAYMDAHPDVAGVGGLIKRREERLLSRFVDHVARMGHKVRDGVVFVLITANACYRRDALEAVGGFDERIPWPEGEDADLSRKVLEDGGSLGVEASAVVAHRHRDSVGGIFKDGKLAGIDHQYRVALGLLPQRPIARTVLGMLRNHLLRAVKAPGPVIEKPVYAWLAVVKAAGLLTGIRAFHKMVSPEDLESGRINEALGGASSLKGGPPSGRAKKP